MIIICNGMKNSGSTLQFNIAQALLKSDGACVPSQLVAKAPFPEDYVVKSHGFVPEMESLIERGYKWLHIHRDIRDVFLSRFRAMSETSDICEAIVAKEVEAHFKIVKVPGVLIQKYEDILDDPIGRVQQIMEYLGVEDDPNAIAEDVSLRRQQELMPELIGPNEGQSTWLAELDMPMANRLTANHKEYLEENGYSTEYVV